MKARPDVIGSYTVTYDNQIVGFIVPWMTAPFGPLTRMERPLARSGS
ncbi:MAG: hypothetical protein K0Q64_2013 [Nitrobacter vulgaris]|jgi:hypothetical protein|nr:hypothetical protein [Nitrobacter vulgaris]